MEQLTTKFSFILILKISILSSILFSKISQCNICATSCLSKTCLQSNISSCQLCRYPFIPIQNNGNISCQLRENSQLSLLRPKILPDESKLKNKKCHKNVQFERLMKSSQIYQTTLSQINQHHQEVTLMFGLIVITDLPLQLELLKILVQFNSKTKIKEITMTLSPEIKSKCSLSQQRIYYYYAKNSFNFDGNNFDPLQIKLEIQSKQAFLFNVNDLLLLLRTNEYQSSSSTSTFSGLYQVEHNKFTKRMLTSCDLNCLTCTGPTSTECSSCQSGLYFTTSLGTCSVACPTMYFQISANLQCQICEIRCQQCTSLTYCTSCVDSGVNEGFLDNSNNCVQASNCPTGTYPETSTHTCDSCSGSCTTCSGDANACTSCAVSQYLLTNVCYADCPVGYYENGVQCSLCQSKCTACQSSSTDCTACQVSGANEAFLDGSSCILANNCPAGTYPETSTHTCDVCNGCATCSGNANTCTSCVVGESFLANVCYSDCPVGYYENGVQCSLCQSKCTACQTSATDCTTCQVSGANEAFLDGNQCILANNCPAGTYPETSTHQCDLCSGGCATCQVNANNCTSCGVGEYLLLNICYSDCPIGYFEDSTQCSLCDPHCIQCLSSAAQCLSCTTTGADQSFLQGTTCYEALLCPDGTYAEISTHICDGCNSSCTACLGDPNNCTSCIGGLYYLSNICYIDCPGAYLQGVLGNCETCDDTCETCDILPTNCSVCTSTGPNQSFLITGMYQCVSDLSCPDGTYGQTSTHICEDCDASVFCQKCSQTATNCTRCLTTYYLLNNMCPIVCPNEYYQYDGSNGGECLSCNSYCYQCTGPLRNQCQSCDTSGIYQAFLLAAQTKCYVNCPISYYKQYNDHSCQKCDISCTQCTDDPSPCQACNPIYSYYNQTCIMICPEAWYSAVMAGIPYFVCQPCAFECLQCYGPTKNNCTVCEYDLGHRLSNTTCDLNCLSGYGYTDVYDICVRCNWRCISCYNLGSNCSSCYTTGSRKGYMYINYPVTLSGRCYDQYCFNNYFGNSVTGFCEICDTNCSKCSKISSNCTECVTGFYYLNFKCYDPCPLGYFINGTFCQACLSKCLECQDYAYKCTVCNPATPAFYYNWRCYTNCPDGYYQSVSMDHTCQECNASCSICDGDPGPCFSCNPGYFYFEKLCYDTCPNSDYFDDYVTMECLFCASHCVKLNITMQFEDVVDQAIIVTMKFSEDLDFTTFPYKSFQNFTFDDSFFTLDMFTFEYSIISDSSYQIKIAPKNYIIMYNVQITVTTMDMPSPNFEAINLRPFSETVYRQSDELTWSLLLTPDLDQNSKKILQALTNISNLLDNFTSIPGVQEIIKSGVVAWIFPGIQITSCIVLVNGLIPRHLYEGVRIMAVFVFYQVPKWQKDAQNSRYVFDKALMDIIPEANSLTEASKNKISISSINNLNFQQSRLLIEISPQWRFKRTGWSMFFIIDTYTQIIFITLSWIILLIMKKCIYKKDQFHKNVGRAWTFLHKVHEVSILYLTMTTVLQWMYFQQQQEYSILNISSLIISLIMFLYFLCYQLYMYFDLFLYPQANIGSRSYLYYATKYGNFLSRIRYQEYNITTKLSWSPKIWFRPYNYHVLSYYKRFLMMFSLPLFHQYPHAQISALISLQILEIVRFCFTWPYAKKVRNIYKLILEVVLLVIFVGVMIEETLSIQLMKTKEEDRLFSLAYYFNIFGWITLGLVMGYNLIILIVMLIDLWKNCWSGGNIPMMDSIRKGYYWQKVKQYEQKNKDIQRKIISKWIKQGNLNEKQEVHKDSQYLIIKIQQIRLQKIYLYFQTNLIQASWLHIKKQSFQTEENSRRITLKEKCHRVFEATSSQYGKTHKLFTKIYDTYQIETIFQRLKEKVKYDNKDQKILKEKQEKQEKECGIDKEQIMIETFLKVDLDKYSNGGKIIYYKNMLYHTISLILNKKKMETIKINQNIEGLPLNVNQMFGEKSEQNKASQDYEKYVNHNESKQK